MLGERGERMNHFLYFLPRNMAVAIRGTDLQPDHPLYGESLQCATQMNGPGGENGMIFHRAVTGDDVFPLSYGGELQTWIKFEREGRTTQYVGMWNDRQPGPADLERKELLRGHPVKLGDERLWTVPVVGPAHSLLPQSYDFLTKSLQIRKQWLPLFKESEKWVGDWKDNSLLEALDFSLLCLKANYLIGEAEATLLGLMGDDNWLQVMWVATGLKDFKDKKEADAGKTTGAA